MKAKAIIEFDKEFIDFVMKEGNLANADELKGFLPGLYASLVEQEKGVKSVEVEIEE